MGDQSIQKIVWTLQSRLPRLRGKRTPTNRRHRP